MTDSASNPNAGEDNRPQDFIRDIVSKDVSEGTYPTIRTRFPPEPNGYLHIGHAKSICLNFGIAREFNGVCNLRFDDTNPVKEDVEYVDSILRDVRWLIDGWADHVLAFKQKQGAMGDGVPAKDFDANAVEPFHASDYFEQLYQFAVELIRKEKAFVCDLTLEQMDEYRGVPERPGKESPFRNRSVEENLDLFARMRQGEFPDGSKTLRARIDMGSPNMWLRDPVLYRIRHAKHHHTGEAWCIYPMYDFAHCLSDALEGITHSICTLEFEVHRPLYDWIVENVTLPKNQPHQYEFARLNLAFTVMSKRRLLQLVQEKRVNGWDDPRMPTISGLRRRGVTAEAIRNLCHRVGVTKFNSLTDAALLEFTIRELMNKQAERRLAVLKPLKLVLTNLPEDYFEEFDAGNNPEDPESGSRKIPFTRELYIEQDDFAEVPPPKYFRLKPGGEVRLKYACIIQFEKLVKDEAGNVVEVHCTADLESRRGGPNAGRKVKGTIHWVSARHAVDAEVRLYDRLFTVPEPASDPEKDFHEFLNSESLEILKDCKVEPSLTEAGVAERYQFERLGYFCIDSADQKTRADTGRLVFNRIVSLRDSWARQAKK